MAEISRDKLDPSGEQGRPTPPRGPLGDVRPDEQTPDPRTGGGKPQERVEDRPNVGSVEPDDYPEDERARSA